MKSEAPTAACVLIGKAIASLVKAKENAIYKDVIQTVFLFNRDFSKAYETENTSNFNRLIEYLRVARTVIFI